ncbi:YeeE/YedE family protein [Vibrio methylphosphonaticus]|uniref:YeeE/YedE family protein n=1 Tax=Vibrio methylphosphonaticus TaxID=2946866 RepID=UPI002029F736|nr:YeeE/YedE family protein [Vibrio methylphosphonaticus]MCL9776307.1 YeeE/YedE family protein [Vibrio methylphosphonaticus]
MMQRVISLISGFLFGIGMIVSGMSDPQNVMAFLDIFGHWSPDLAFVMGGALLVFAPSYWLIIRKKAQPVCTDQFCISDDKKIDIQLLSGSALFGLGWGIAGICPGPAISSIANGSTGIVGFVVMMIVGMFIGDILLSKRNDSVLAKQ